MPTYRKKPVIVEAYRWQPGIQLPGIDEVDVEEPAFIEPRRLGRFTTIHGQLTYVGAGDYVIREPDGVHWYPCTAEIFEATYERVEEETMRQGHATVHFQGHEIDLGPGAVGQVSDGYHTFDELYEHRCLLFLGLLKALKRGWISQQHADGTMYEGWFIAGLDLCDQAITYHLPMTLWPLASTLPRITIYAKAPAWDGHTPADVVRRLDYWLTFGEE